MAFLKGKRVFDWRGYAAVAISVATLCLTLCRIEPLTIDWMGVLVGVLSLLVMLLIGWQIYSMFDVKGEIEEIRQDVDSSMMKVSQECGILSTSIYSTLFNEIRQKEVVDIYGYFRYGLLVIIHAQSINNMGLCKSIIKVLVESFPVTKPIRNHEKADILHLAAKINETPIASIFDNLYEKLICELKSCD